MIPAASDITVKTIKSILRMIKSLCREPLERITRTTVPSAIFSLSQRTLSTERKKAIRLPQCSVEMRIIRKALKIVSFVQISPKK